MKKFAALLMSVMLVFGVSSCSQQTDDNADSGNEIVSSTEDSVTESESSEEEADSADNTSVDSTEETNESDEDSAESEADLSVADNSSAANENVGGDTDISGAIDYTEATQDNPAEIGQWVKTSIYSATDSTYHSVYARITNVTARSEDESYVNAAIEKHNSVCSEYYQIDEDELKVPSDCELQVLEYEVYVPDDFPTNDWGIISPNIRFSEVNATGGGIPSADGASTYIGLGSPIVQLETGEEPDYYQVGETYSYTYLYMMVQGYEDYLFSIDSYPDGTTDVSEAEYGHAYYKHS